ncbi:MAG: HAMP domain-containing protein [Candidatus Omnitrophica bacterium]|nr:HAMP domain-containing protein [Candidatus Omnitrophota bacterium]
MMARANQRRVYFIEKKFQTHFIIKFCLLVILGSLTTGILLCLLSGSSTTVTFQNLRATVMTTSDFLLPVLIQIIIISTAVVAIATMFLTLFISHRIAGPLYRFKREFSKIESGDLKGDFRIRKNDQLQDIALSIDNMVKRLKDVIVELKNQSQLLINSKDKFLDSKILEDQKIYAEETKKIIENIKKALDYFKI